MKVSDDPGLTKLSHFAELELNLKPFHRVFKSWKNILHDKAGPEPTP